MNQSEPTTALRVISARLFATDGTALPLNHVFSAGDLKLVQPDGTVANAIHLPVARTGAATGSFDIQLDVSECTQVGNLRLQLTANGVVYWEWIEPVTTPIGVFVWQTLRTGNQPAGSFGEILDARISTIVAQHVAATVTPLKSYSLVQGALEPDMEIDVVDLDGSAVNLSAAILVQLRWSKPGALATLATLTAINLVQGQMKRVWSSGDTDLVGTHRAQVVVTMANGEPAIYPRDGSQYQWLVYPKLA